MKVFEKPKLKPACPNFGCGPTAKQFGWNIQNINTRFLGRSHRSFDVKKRIRYAIETTKEVLLIPQNYKVAIVLGSATGAMECLLWNLLGSRPVDVIWTDVFGKLWAYDIEKELKIKHKQHTASFGCMPNLEHTPHHDLVLTINGTTSGLLIKDFNWVKDDRSGLVIGDATSSAGAMNINWEKFDGVGFSWQKGFGGEGAHGMIILSPKAIEHIRKTTPSWPIPRLMRIKRDGVIHEPLFIDEPINTPSILCIEDYIVALENYKSLGGIHRLNEIVQQNFSVIDRWIQQSEWASWAVSEEKFRSTISPCIVLKPLQEKCEETHRKFLHTMGKVLSDNQAAFDIINHKFAQPSLRIWCGPNISRCNLEKLTPWLDYAFNITYQSMQFGNL